ncbi:MAG: ABC transporter ATP-binding protein [Candidatus Dormibacter sp.]
MTDSAPILDVRELHRHFLGVQAVRGVSFTLQAGRLTGLIGPNGAGKSTVLQMLSGMIPVTSGQVMYEGRDVTSDPMYRRARLGLIRTFQHASEFKRLTVLENLLSSVPDHPGDSLVGSLIGPRRWRRREAEAADRAQQLLERFRLTEHAQTYAGELSGGQRRLVEIMRALMADPKLLLLDEPMAGVHPHLAMEISAHLSALRAEGLTILMVEHELSVVDRLCDRVIVMAEGRILADGVMADLRLQREVVDAYLVG